MDNDYSNGYDVEFHIQYLKWVMPKRCKVARALEKEDVQTYRIEGATEEEAPVAMRVHWDEEGKAPTDYRLYHGELFKACSPEEERTVLCPQFIGGYHDRRVRPLPKGHSFKENPVSKDLPEWRPGHGNYELDAQTEKARAFASRYLLIGGKLHETAGEPHYKTRGNLGFGGWWYADPCEYGGSYNANDLNLLEAEVERIGANWPDASVSIGGRIEVLMPEAVAEPSHAERTYLEHVGKLQSLFQDTVENVQRRLCGERMRRGKNGLEPVDPYIPHCKGCPLANDGECVVRVLESKVQALEAEEEDIRAKHAERRKRGWNPAA